MRYLSDTRILFVQMFLMFYDMQRIRIMSSAKFWR